MNKYLIVIVCMMLSMSCKSKDVDVVPPTINISAKKVSFSYHWGEQVILVNCNQEFTVSSSSSWCSVETLEDQTGVRVTVTANEDVERTAAVTVSCGNVSEQIIVIQSAVQPNVIVKEKEVLIILNRDFTLEITANIPVVFDLPEWILEKDGNQPVTGKKTYSFQASALPEDMETRTGNLTVKSVNADFAVSIVIPVKQSLGNPDSPIVDLALIYQGGYRRIDWNQDHFKPFLTWTNPDTQEEEWLFDGFLFIEIYSGNVFYFEAATGDPLYRPINKADFLWWLDQVFVENRSIDALDKAVGKTIERLGSPPRPHRVVLMVPDAICEVTNNLRFWGELNGKTLDFGNDEDRIAAIKWYIDMLMDRWNRKTYKNIELAGFYWVVEDIGYYSRASNRRVLPVIGQYVRSLSKQFYWIPYNNASGSSEWKALGSDIAYQQPGNYFYSSSDSQLAETCSIAMERGMGLEMEWDESVWTNPQVYAPRMHRYLDIFEQRGVWQNAVVAHYMGSGDRPGMIGLSQTNAPEAVALYKKYCSILADRQKKFWNK